MFIIKYRSVFFAISVLAVLLSIFAIFYFGLNLGMDFRGGSIMEVRFMEEAPALADINQVLTPQVSGTIAITPSEDGFIARFGHIGEEEHQAMLSALSELGEFEEKRFSTVGPVLGAELARRGLIALVLVVLLIIVYIAIAFRGATSHRGGVSSWKYGLIAIFALAHDIIIPAGIFAALGYYKGIEIDALFLTALLTVLGVSVNDTIVVFDRIRENLRHAGPANFAETVGKSLRQTLTRSLNTSLTVIFVLLALFFLGSESTRWFALALTIGMAVGTYSSIFLASPLLVTWSRARTTKS